MIHNMHVHAGASAHTHFLMKSPALTEKYYFVPSMLMSEKEKKGLRDFARAVSGSKKPSVQDYKSDDKNELGKTKIVEEPTKKEAKRAE